MTKKKWLIVVIGIFLILSGLTINKSNKIVQAKKVNLEESIINLKDDMDKLLLDELEEEYEEVKLKATNILEENKSKEFESIINEINSFKTKVLEYNKKIFDEKYELVKNEDIKDLKEEMKNEIDKAMKEIEALVQDEKYKDAINKVDECSEYIKSSKELIEKEKLDKLEEEKRKQEEIKKQEEEKKKEEASNNATSGNSSSNNNNTNTTPTVEQSFASKLKVANSTDSIITVVGLGGSRAEVKLHKKINGLWKEVISTNGFVGYNGIGESKREGDGKTPAGVYTFGFGFGIANNPGANLSYRKVTDGDYWVDDSNSKYYNQWVNINNVEKDWNSAEHLMSYPNQYKYGVTLNYNTSNAPDKGSAIFLHCATKNTAGCIGVPESVMIKLLKEINSNTRIVIGVNKNQILNY